MEKVLTITTGKTFTATTPWESNHLACRRNGRLPVFKWKRRMKWAVAFDADLSQQVSGRTKQADRPERVVLGLGLLVACEKSVGLALNQNSTISSLPSTTVTMVCVLSTLLLLDRFSPSSCTSLVSFFNPSLVWLQRWMPLFYAPPLAMLPLEITRMKVSQGVLLLLLTVGSWVSTFVVTASWAFLVRRYVHPRLEEPSYLPSPQVFTFWELVTWVVLGGLSFVLVILSPNILGSAARTTIPFFVAVTVSGFLFGSLLPGPVKRILHPVVTCAIFVNAGAVLYSLATKQKYASILGHYVGKVTEPGAGYLFMSFLGPLVVSYAFVLYRQRRIIKHHLVELGSVIPVSGAFSLFFRAFAGRRLGLDAQLVNSVIPSSTTFAFCLPICSTLKGNSSLGVTMCILTGFLGAHLSKLIFSAMTKRKDLIVEGLATACSSHGYGSATIAADEADLLPFCVVSYILLGAFCSFICRIPCAG